MSTCARALGTARRLPAATLVKFGLIGSICFGIQVAVMVPLLRLGVTEAQANAVGFGLSAQCNYALSRSWTFRDRLGPAARSSPFFRQIGAFNLIVLIGLVVNSAMFKGVRAVEVPIQFAVVVAILASSTVVFLANYFGVFRGGRSRHAAPPPAHHLGEHEPAGIAFFMPAHNEAGNIRPAVDDVLGTHRDLGVPHRVIVVDDGSSDETFTVASELAEEHDVVSVIRHERNSGYGAALRTGFQAAHRTGMPLVGFFDADRQFRGEDLASLLGRLRSTGADMVVGYRKTRADSLKRRLMGRAWHWLSRRMLGFGARDVDCGYKLMRREVLDEVLPHLDGEHAAISPQLLALTTRAGFRIEEIPVNHYAREYGQQSGGGLRVAVRSLVDLVRLRAATRRMDLSGSGTGRRPSGLRRTDPVVRAVVVTASALSVAAFIYFAQQGVVLSYMDGISHLLIARRVVDGLTPGLAQLGGVWLPLPHLLMTPLVGFDDAYYSGFAGSFVSMVSYVVTGVFVYRIGWRLTGRRSAGLVAAAVFLLNPNVLYMQSVPMTELLLFACTSACIYGLLRWIQSGNYLQLVGAAIAVLLATLTRYEGWVLLFAAVTVVAYHGIRQRMGRSQIEGMLIGFLTMAAVGIAGWMAWNQLILGDWIGFQRGEYARPSNWVSGADKAVGHLPIAVETYARAVTENLTPAVAVASVIGLIAYMYRTRLSAESMPVLSLLGFFPFFVVALYAGQRPLHVEEISGDLYNVRFGLVMILPAAVFVGYLTSAVGPILAKRWLRVVPATALGCVTLATAAVTVPAGDIVTLQEPVGATSTAWTARARTASTFLRENYRGGRLLMETFGNEQVEVEARIPQDERIHEGSYRLWEPALADPRGNAIDWIYMRRSRGEDKVYRALHGSAKLQAYRQVYADQDRVIYASPRAVDD
jgi:putative flippase GtrA/4-amino-4-deoxy-L-arabinose transferase-like glycosyltransferase